MKKQRFLPFLIGILPVCALAAPCPLPVSEDFTDATAYRPGPLAGQRGWSVEQGAALVAGDGSGQYLEIPAASPNGQISLYFENPEPGKPVFLDFMVRMGAEDRALELVDANGSVTGMLRVERNGKLLALHRAADGTEQWLDTAVRVDLDAGGEMRDWLRLTFRQDGAAKTWDLYAGGKLRAANLGLASDSRESGGYLSLMGGEAHPVRLRSVAVDTHNMLFGDADGDGLPDAWQKKLPDGGRDADPDADGLTNLEEFIHGTAADNADSDGDGVTDPDELAAGTDPLNAGDGQEPQGVFVEIQPIAFPDPARYPRGLYECRRDGVFRRPPPAMAGIDRLEWNGLLREDDHASRVRGLLTAPVSGDYTFWISGDDSAEFALSADDTPFARRETARCPSATAPLDFGVFGSQRSAPVRLEAGRRYYFEIVHQTIKGPDHFAVAWQPPGGARAVISGRWLTPWTGDARDADDDGLPDEWQRSTGLYAKSAAAALPEADPDGDRLTNLEECRLGSNPLAADAEGRPGLVTREIWFNMPGRYLLDAARSGEFPKNPWWTEYRGSLESPQDVGRNFLARTRGWLVIPETGAYTFYLAADDQAGLWLGENADQFSKRRIASVPLATGWHEWGRFPSQTSAPLQLARGQKLYIETLHKQGQDGSHLSVAWTGPGIQTPTVVGGENLVSWERDPNDANDDGLPDEWQARWGLVSSGDTPRPGEAKKLSAWGDADGDGISNGAELAAGTDPSNPLSHPDTGVQWQIWEGVPGNTLDAVQGLESFPARPQLTRALTELDYGTQGDNYLSRIRGLLTAPVTGRYVFSLAASNHSRLYLSGNAASFGKRVIAEIPLVSPWRDKDWNKWQQSAPIALEAGQDYYFEVIHKAGTQEDFMTVGWNIPGFGQSIITGEFLKPYPLDPEDLDDDGLPDAWESANGLNPENPSGADGAWGDPDGDLLTNFDECHHGTAPLVPDSAGHPGLALWEVWESIPGASPASLLRNPRFPGMPDRRELLESAETPPDRGESYGARLRGFLVPPVSGQYRLLVSADDQAVLSVGTGEGKFSRRPVASVPQPSGERDFNRWPEQSGLLSLEAGRSYYFELIHKEDGARNHATLAWIPPGGDVPVIIAGNSLAAFRTDPEDLDDDELPDSWELAHGLDAGDNGNTSFSNGPWGDPDRDLLANIDEWRLGTDPMRRDTDGDGLDDGLEHTLTGTDPLKDDASALAVFAGVGPAAAVPRSGNWTQQGDLLVLEGQNGSVDLPFTLASPGLYFMRLSAAGTPVTGDAEESVSIAVDGLALGDFPLAFTGGTLREASGRLPYLGAGAHTLSVSWASPRPGRGLAVASLEIVSFAAADGTAAPWGTERARTLNGITERPRASLTSPLCLEGFAEFPSLVTLSGGQPVLEGPDGTWHAEVELPADGAPLPVTAGYENGVHASSAEFVWTALNVLDGGELTIRRGDSLRLAAVPEDAGASGQIVIRVDGQETGRAASGGTVIQAFPQAGVYKISADFQTAGAGAVETGEITVTVMEANLPAELLVFAGRAREVTLGGVPEDAVVRADSSLYWLERSSPPRQVSVRRSQAGTAFVTARLPGGGAILDRMPVRSLAPRSAMDSSLALVGQYGDGTTIVEMDVFLPDMPAGARIRIEIIAPGVTFDDGSLVKWLTREDFDANGVAKVRFVRAPGVLSSICHVLSVWQDDKPLGNY